MHHQKGFVLLWILLSHPIYLAKESNQCHFSSYSHHPQVTSYEFQLDIPKNKCTGFSRKDLLSSISKALLNISSHSHDNKKRGIDLRLHVDSLRTSIFDQYSTALTTLDGKPLFPSKCTPTILPWRGPAFIRHRRKHAMYYGLNQTSIVVDSFKEPLGVRAGRGDLTLKIKDVNLDAFTPLHLLLKFPKRVKIKHHHHASRMKFKIENDRYCNVGRSSYEAMYHPVALNDDKKLCRRDQVEHFFPGLWRYLGYRNRNILPMYNERYFSKSVWDAHIAGVPGVVNWVVSYPSLLDALTGGPGVDTECELSFRLKKECGSLHDALREAVAACDVMHENGWDTGIH